MKKKFQKMNQFYGLIISRLIPFIILLTYQCQFQSVHAHYLQWEYHELPPLPPPPLPPQFPQLQYIPSTQFIPTAQYFPSTQFISSPPHRLPPPQPPIRRIIPSEIMVDLTNDFAYRLLNIHSQQSNRNNMAFSPTALVSVMIALYEGSAGRSSIEIQHVLGLPDNRDICRIGYRDIHRRLRTYFFEQDNPLIGLSLNKENITITIEYEAILKFYGYDLGIDMVSSAPAPTTEKPREMTTKSSKPVGPLNVNERTEIGETTAMSEITRTESSAAPETTTLAATTTTTPQPTTTSPDPTTTTSAPTTTPAPTTTTIKSVTTTTEKLPETTVEITTASSETTTQSVPSTTPNTPETSPTTTDEATETTTMDNEPKTTTESESESIERTTILSRNPARSAAIRVRPLTNDENHMFPPSRRSTRFGSQIQLPFISTSSITTARQIKTRAKRHYLGGLDYRNNFYSGNFPTTNLNPALDSSVYLAFIPSNIGGATAVDSQHSVAKDFGFYDNFAPGNLNGVESDKNDLTPKETPKETIINHAFYLNPQETIQATYKTYNSILNYKHLDAIKMSVLEMELDSNDYNLVIMLPDFSVDVDTAISSLKLAPTLRALRKQLKPRWVQAIIPDFEMKGNIYLTNDLQTMGVNDIFEPSRANFTPMSDMKGIYAKHIEQSINVHIRTRPIDQIKRNIARQYRPIEVAVNHPFLFFIVDKELDVALMAGKVLNPLNVRIQ